MIETTIKGLKLEAYDPTTGKRWDCEFLPVKIRGYWYATANTWSTDRRLLELRAEEER